MITQLPLINDTHSLIECPFLRGNDFSSFFLFDVTSARRTQRLIVQLRATNGASCWCWPIVHYLIGFVSIVDSFGRAPRWATRCNVFFSFATIALSFFQVSFFVSSTATEYESRFHVPVWDDSLRPIVLILVTMANDDASPAEIFRFDRDTYDKVYDSYSVLTTRTVEIL